MSGEHPKFIGSAGGRIGGGSEETLLRFPTAFPIKAMGRMAEGGTQSHFAQIVIDIVRKHAPDLIPNWLKCGLPKTEIFYR